MKVGDTAQYNKKYSESEVVKILKIEGNICLVVFPSGAKMATRLSGLWPIVEPEEITSEHQLKLFPA